MDSKDESPVFEMTEIEQVRTEQREATSSNILPLQDDKTDKEKTESKVSDEKTVSQENSSVSIAESSNTVDNKIESKDVSSSDSVSSTLVPKEKEVLCQVGDTVASSGSLTFHSGSEYVREGSKEEKQTPKSVVSSLSSKTLAEVAKDIVKATKESIDSTAAGPSFLTAVAAKKEEKDIEPAADSTSNPPGVEIRMADFPRVSSSQKTVSSSYSRETTVSTSSENEVLPLKTLASQKAIPEVYRFGSSSKDEINTNNDFQGTVTATSDLSYIGANSTQCENKETENEDTAVLNTRQQEAEEDCEDNETRAFFYISSCSVPGMGEGSEWPSVSDGYQMPVARPVHRIIPQQRREPRRCLGTRRCHYVIAAIAFLTAFIGCIAYHLSNSGIGPDVLKPIGASTAFISFAVCVISAVYINYLRNYPGLPTVPNYELLGDVDSVMAMNRSSDPEFYYAEDGTCVSRGRTAASEYNIRETQSADVLDRRGYLRHSTGSLQTDCKRCSEESGTPYSTQPPKKFKAMESSGCQEVEESNDGMASSSPHTCEGVTLDSQTSDDSETRPLLRERDD